jgi:hypothetical protein
MLEHETQARLARLERCIFGIQWLLVSASGAEVFHEVNEFRHTSFEESPLMWTYELSIVLFLAGLAAWVVAKIVGYPVTGKSN